MGYRVNTRKKKDGTVYWRVIFEAREGGERKDQHIAGEQLLAHGFLPSMSLGEAKARAKQLNALGKLERQKVKALSGLKQQALVKSAHLPEALLQEFAK